MPLLKGASFFALVGFIQEPVARKGGESAGDRFVLNRCMGETPMPREKSHDSSTDWQKTWDDADLRRQGRCGARDGRAGWAVSCDAGQDQRDRWLQRRAAWI